MPTQSSSTTIGYYRVGDTAPDLERQLIDGRDVPYDLTGAHVFLTMAPVSRAILGSLAYPSTDTLIYRSPCRVLGQSTHPGWVAWTPAVDQLSQAGVFALYFEIEWPDGRWQSIDPKVYKPLVVNPKPGYTITPPTPDMTAAEIAAMEVDQRDQWARIRLVEDRLDLLALPTAPEVKFFDSLGDPATPYPTAPPYPALLIDSFSDKVVAYSLRRTPGVWYDLIEPIYDLTVVEQGIASNFANISNINNALGQVVTGIMHEEAVLSIVDTPPASPAVDETYIVGAAPTGVFVGHANEVTLWNGTTWVFDPPQSGEAHLVEDQRATYAWNGAAWVKVITTVPTFAFYDSAGDPPPYIYPPATADFLIDQFNDRLIAYNQGGAWFDLPQPTDRGTVTYITDTDPVAPFTAANRYGFGATATVEPDPTVVVPAANDFWLNYTTRSVGIFTGVAPAPALPTGVAPEPPPPAAPLFPDPAGANLGEVLTIVTGKVPDWQPPTRSPSTLIGIVAATSTEAHEYTWSQLADGNVVHSLPVGGYLIIDHLIDGKTGPGVPGDMVASGERATVGDWLVAVAWSGHTKADGTPQPDGFHLIRHDQPRPVTGWRAGQQGRMKTGTWTTWEKIVSSGQFRKELSSTALLVTGSVSGFVQTAGTIGQMGFGRDGITPAVAGSLWFNADAVHFSFSGRSWITGVPSGDHTVELWVSVGAGGAGSTFGADQNDNYQFDVWEVEYVE
jgi:hypothetical protein